MLDQEKLITSPIYGWIDGPESRPIKVDKWSRGLIVVTNEEHQTFRGYNFIATASSLVATSGGKFGIRIDTNYSRPLLQFSISVSTSGIYRRWFPSASGHVPGNELGVLNRNIKSQILQDPVSGISLCHSPASADTDGIGTKIYMGSAAGPGGRISSGGDFGSKLLLYLDNIAYFEVETTSNDCAVNFEFHWSEQIPYDTPPLIVPV